MEAAAGRIVQEKENRGAYGLGREGPRRGFVQNNGTDGGDDSGGEASAVEKAWLKSGEALIGEGKGLKTERMLGGAKGAAR